ncbi:helix-turn-helix domain-containing protein [Deinococcus sp. Leaf326]|uniref:helix-turn-helix domain-containing protein n=1 Tax=Deinococcus sp. Leaf326 TaxID=1736338 RepID=UPI0009EC69C0|nr:helix-turn-helix domain-containing protein [Deinococcus sp. Leaf326]
MNATKRLTTNLSINTSEMNVLFVHSALDDYPLTPEEFRLYAHLARRASSGAAYPSRASMASACRMHEDTVGVALKNLLAFKMLDAHERKGKTTLYTLTQASKWVKPQVVEALHVQQAQIGAARRADRKARKAAAAAAAPVDPPETKGGVEQSTPPERRVGYPPETKGYHPPETKGDEGNPLRRSIKGGVLDVTGDPREGGPLSTPVAEPRSATHSSSTDSAAPKTSTHEAGPLGTIVGAALASVAPVPQVKASQPDGAAVAAGQEILVDSRNSAKPRGGMNEQATSLENVPGGAAGAGTGAAEGARGAGDGAGRAGVDSIRPVDAQTLAARPVAPLDGPAYKSLKSLLGNGLTSMLKEVTRTGQISRELWLRLEEGEIGLVRVLAQEEAKLTSANMITLAVRGLDRLIGAVKVEKQASPTVVAADPQLVAGQRCTVADQVGALTLGVVVEVNAVRYKIRFDDGNGRDVDRKVVAQLRTLKASDASLAPALAVAPALEGPTLFVPAGTSWRRIAGKGGQPGEIVTVQAVLGNTRKLSNGTNLPFYTIQRDFEQVSA